MLKDPHIALVSILKELLAETEKPPANFEGTDAESLCHCQPSTSVSGPAA
jgi:hypothetical protein